VNRHPPLAARRTKGAPQSRGEATLRREIDCVGPAEIATLRSSVGARGRGVRESGDNAGRAKRKRVT
jgi:hypothetical protein